MGYKTTGDGASTVPKLTYNPAVFDRSNLDEARGIILTPEGSTTDDRWTVETPLVCELIKNAIAITAETLILDFGCGIGRIAKELIRRHGCKIVGIDISDKMRAMAADYVGPGEFCAYPLDMLEALVHHGVQFDAAIAIWVLQHSFNPSHDISLLRAALKQSGRLFVLNNTMRSVPTKERSWVSDGFDVKNQLVKAFAIKQEGILPSEVIAPWLVGNHFWAVFVNNV
jgi:cyclopropane fatty-acyl-phospholipid synthase-like methyltransferase